MKIHSWKIYPSAIALLRQQNFLRFFLLFSMVTKIFRLRKSFVHRRCFCWRLSRCVCLKLFIFTAPIFCDLVLVKRWNFFRRISRRWVDDYFGLKTFGNFCNYSWVKNDVYFSNFAERKKLIESSLSEDFGFRFSLLNNWIILLPRSWESSLHRRIHSYELLHRTSQIHSWILAADVVCVSSVIIKRIPKILAHTQNYRAKLLMENSIFRISSELFPHQHTRTPVLCSRCAECCFLLSLGFVSILAQFSSSETPSLCVSEAQRWGRNKLSIVPNTFNEAPSQEILSRWTGKSDKLRGKLFRASHSCSIEKKIRQARKLFKQEFRQAWLV